MGVKIKDIVVKDVIDVKDLKFKTLAVDAFNMLYQFLSTIRQPDGTPLMDDAGVTSHLAGIIYRVTNLLSEGLKLIFVFETKSPELKEFTKLQRSVKKIEAKAKYDEAKDEANLEEMKKYAMQTTRLNENMINESKELLTALGCAVIEIPFEGEAVAAKIVQKGKAYAVVSQDYDSLLFGATKVVRNLSVSKRRKVGGTYVKVDIELIDLEKTLKKFGIDLDQLIVIGILSGTDFNPGGIPGIGAKKALELVKQYGHNFDALFTHVEWDKYYEYSWKKVFEIFKKDLEIPEIKFPKYDRNKVFEILCERHRFSRERIENALKTLEKSDMNQSSLMQWFK